MKANDIKVNTAFGKVEARASGKGKQSSAEENEDRLLDEYDTDASIEQRRKLCYRVLANEDSSFTSKVLANLRLRKIEIEAEMSAAIVAATTEGQNRDEIVKKYKQSLDEIEAAIEQADKEKKKKDEERLTEEQMYQDRLVKMRLARVQAIKEMERQEGEETLAQWQSGYRGKMRVASQFMGEFIPLMESKNRRLFEIGKAASIAQTTIDTIEGAQKAFNCYAELPIVGVPMGIAAAAAATIAGMIRIQKIQATKFGGGGNASDSPMTAPSMGSAGGEQGGVTYQNTVNVSLQGDRFSQQQVRQLVQQINEVQGSNVRVRVAA
jgi:hypothetical protein